MSEPAPADEPAVTADEPATDDAVAATDEAAEEEAPAPSPATPVAREPAITGRFPLSVSRPVALATLAVVVGLLIAAASLAVVLVRHSAVERASTEALTTARSYAVTVTSYDYRTLDSNFTDVLNGATGEFKDQYGAASKTLRNLVTQAQATAKGTVLNAGVESATTDRVVVLLFMDQAITNAANRDSRTDRSRLLITLTKNDGRWLASKVELR